MWDEGSELCKASLSTENPAAVAVVCSDIYKLTTSTYIILGSHQHEKAAA
jgi:hypothetical protein